jgi:hypothetical protein
MARAQATTNHDKIRSWVESRGGHPAAVKTTRNVKSPGGLLRIDFGPQEENLEEIGWDDFFRTFDGNDLAFLYQEKTADGHTSRFFKFVSRETLDEDALNATAEEDEDEDYDEDEDEDEDVDDDDWDDEDDEDDEDLDEDEDEEDDR